MQVITAGGAAAGHDLTASPVLISLVHQSLGKVSGAAADVPLVTNSTEVALYGKVARRNASSEIAD